MIKRPLVALLAAGLLAGLVSIWIAGIVIAEDDADSALDDVVEDGPRGEVDEGIVDIENLYPTPLADDGEFAVHTPSADALDRDGWPSIECPNGAGPFRSSIARLSACGPTSAGRSSSWSSR